jgi:uncharacterized protein YlxW (UPF0749 family)
MKILSALFFALVTTVIIAVTMLVIGGNALLNKNSVPILNSPAAAAIPKSADAASTNLQQQVDQMQQLINQYQDREKQYQAELQQAAQQLNTANAQIGQDNQDAQVYQQVLTALQQRGLIRITSDGQIFITRGGN